MERDAPYGLTAPRRAASTPTTCEFDAPAEDGFDLFFPDYDAPLADCKQRFKRWP
ncbi:MAG: hypothetical protein PVF51_03490 [Nitrospirota bacterium]